MTGEGPSDDEIADAGALSRVAIADFEQVRSRHVDLVASAGDVTSIRDFGGLWLVHGAYLLESAVRTGSTFVSMIDATIQPEFKQRIDEARESSPELEVELINTDFRRPELYDIVRPVDVSLLYNVLLHQENHVEIISDVCRTTTKFVCVAQPCLREEYFSLPASAAIIQFWPDDLKAKYQEGAFWPPEPRLGAFNPGLWIWAHSTSHLISAFYGCGWRLDFGEVIEDAVGPHWEYPMLRFRPATGTSQRADA
jgi:hypothetical protein